MIFQIYIGNYHTDDAYKLSPTDLTACGMLKKNYKSFYHMLTDLHTLPCLGKDTSLICFFLPMSASYSGVFQDSCHHLLAY